MPTPEEARLLERIRELEEMNSRLQDKLDMIWAVLEPEYQFPDEVEDGDDSNGLVQIQGIQ